MIKSCWIIIILVAALACTYNNVSAQAGCDGTVPTYYVDFTNFPGGTYTTPAIQRQGNCCATTSPDRCVHFDIILDPGTAAISLEIASGAVPSGALFYQMDCGAQTQIPDQICVLSGLHHDVTFCKSGNNTNQYRVHAIPKPKFPLDDTVRVGCTKTFGSLGLIESTATWTSIYPGVQGAYNGYLNCTSGCDTVTVTPGAGAPAYIDYKLCATAQATGCNYGNPVCDTFRVYTYPLISASVTPNPASFCAASGGTTLNSVVSGGLAPYTYTWKNSSGTTVGTSSSYLATAAGSYSLTVKDVLTACPSTTIPITVNVANVTLTPNHTNVTCNGLSNGTASISATGGATPYSYAWQGGGTTSSISGKAAGTYSVVVSDNGGCTATASITITQPTALTANIDSTFGITCYRNRNGIIYLSRSGGTPGYTYLWSPGGFTGQVPTSLDTGTYTVVVTDSKGCTVSKSATLTEPSTVVNIAQPAGSATNLLCWNDHSGKASVDTSVLGGTSPYSLLWSTGSSSTSITSLSIGTYSVHITDKNGCTSDTSFTLTQPDTISTQFLGFTSYFGGYNISCHDSANGQVDFDVIGGGTPGYTYSWNSGAYTTQDLTNVPAGIYNVKVTDAHGCTATKSITLTQPDSMVVTITSPVYPGGYNISCKGANNGKIFTNVTGGTPFYYFNWTTPSGLAPDSDLIKLYADFYSVTVTDINGCIAMDTITLTEPDTIVPLIDKVDINGVNLRCANSNDGLVFVDTVFGGTAPFTFTWDEFNIQDTLTNATAGPHSLLISDVNGCLLDTTVVLTQPDPIVKNISVSQFGSYQLSCYGSCNGFVTVDTVFGGVPPYTYSWSQGGTTSSISSLCQGTYSVVISDANACLDSTSLQLDQPDTLQLSATPVNVQCFNTASGSIDISMLGGTNNYIYAWSPTNDSTSYISNLDTGTYCLHVVDDNGCFVDTCFTLTQPTALVMDSVVSPTFPGGWTVSCYAGTNGSIYAYASGGTSPYAWYWSNGDSTQNTFNVSVSTYYITATDGNGCTAVDSITLSEPPKIVTTVQSKTDVACNGDATGAITVSSVGGTAPYTYSMDGVTFTPSATFNNLPQGTYTIYTADTNGCADSIIVSVNQPVLPLSASTLSKTNVDCFGNSTGDITISAGGGTMPYRYSMDGGTFQPSATFSGLAASTFTVTVMDTNGCSVMFADSITQPLATLQVTASSANAACFGDSSGTALATVTGGTQSYAYSWSPSGGTDSSATVLKAGTYTVTITDANGCMALDSTVITQPTPLNTTLISKTDVACFNDSSGVIVVSASGGVSPYRYSMDGISYSPDSTFMQLPIGSYTIYASDTNGCVNTLPVSIVQPGGALQAQVLAKSDVDCFGNANGTITMTGVNGISPYQYSIDGVNFQPVGFFGGLSGGPVTITVVDSSGTCTYQLTDTIQEPSQPLSAVLTTTDVKCFNGSDGTVVVTVNGGTAGYAYNWSNSATTDTLTAVPAGTYSLTVTDANNCVIIDSATVNEPAQLMVSHTLSQVKGGNVSCTPGFYHLNVSGGISPYSFNWSTSDSTQDLDLIGAGSYSVTVTDSNGCAVIDSATLVAVAPMSLSLTASDFNGYGISCYGSKDGSIMTNVTGVTSPYSFAWLPTNDTTQNVNNLDTGNYVVVVTDTNNCTATDSIYITQPPVLSVIDSVQDVLCNGGTTGSVELTVSGGASGYAYQWSNSATTQNITAAAGSYTYTVTDANGCFRIDSASINSASSLVVTHTLSSVKGGNVSCNPGFYHLTVNGGTSPYSFNWSTSDTTQDLNSIGAGSYSVTVTDKNGCAAIDSATLVAAPQMALTLTPSDFNGYGISCFGSMNGSIMANVTGVTNPYLFAWLPVNDTTQSITGLDTGLYIVTVTDTNNCTATDSVYISQPPAISISGVVQDAPCNSGNTGSVDITVTGGVSGYTYSWTNSATTQDISSLGMGTYSVQVTDANNCVDSASFTVNQPGSLTHSITSSQLSTNYNLCFGDSSGYAQVNVSGGTAPYSYIWSNNVTTPKDSGLKAGTYVVTVVDSNGCSFMDSVTLREAPFFTANAGQSEQICGNTAVLTAALSAGHTGMWTIQNGSGTIDSIGNPAATVTGLMYTPGANVLQWMVMDSAGCMSADTVSIEAFEATTAASAVGDSVCPDSASDARLMADQPAVGTGKWNQLGSALVNNPNNNISGVNGLVSGDNFFQWVVTNGPCSASQTVDIYMKKASDCFHGLVLPNGITPNGDQHNDNYDIQGITSFPSNTFQVFNRWGNEVFSMKDYSNQWHGQNNSGEPLPDGTYFVILIVKGANIELHSTVDVRRN